MLSKNLHEITIADLDELITGSIPEGKQIEYKQILPGSSDRERKEFLSDVSSFANTQGGYLIYGLKETGGRPTAIEPISCNDTDAEIRRMDSIILSGVEPRIKHEIRSVAHSKGHIFLLRIEQSWSIPHRVIFGGHDKFYARTSAGKYQLDTEELRKMFTFSLTINKEVEKLIEKMRIGVSGDKLPMTPKDGPRFSLHLIPLESWRALGSYDVLSIKDDHDFIPISHPTGWTPQINFEGAFTYSGTADGRVSYVQIYRNAIIEAVDALGFWTDDKTIPLAYFEKQLLEMLPKYLRIYEKLGISSPVVGYLSFHRVNDYKLLVNPRTLSSHSPPALNVSSLYLPNFLIEDFQITSGKILRPSFNIDRKSVV